MTRKPVYYTYIIFMSNPNVKSMNTYSNPLGMIPSITLDHTRSY